MHKCEVYEKVLYRTSAWLVSVRAVITKHRINGVFSHKSVKSTMLYWQHMWCPYWCIYWM